MEFNDDDFLAISGIQHFVFCRRQWALIHIEKVWRENVKTIEGEIMHQRAHNETLKEKRGKLYIVRALKVMSRNLGITGECDVVEFKESIDGIYLSSFGGKYIPYPVEYKHGSPRDDLSNEMQLCAQAMCLEEMLCCDIKEGSLFFGEIKRRVVVQFDDKLRSEVLMCLKEMRQLYDKKHTPKVKPHKGCNSCSLKDICLPKICKTKSVKEYLMERCME